MTDLKGELASLRIDREQPGAQPLALARCSCSCRSCSCWAPSTRCALPPVLRGTGGADGARAASSQPGQPSAGSAVLTASGYVVARRKAVVSAKIQGRLAELRVEEGSRVREGDVIARLESVDYEAQVQRAQAPGAARRRRTWRRRGARRASRRAWPKESVLSRTSSRPRRAACRSAEASLAQAQAELGFAQAQLAEHAASARRSPGVVVKKMAEVGESVAPIPPGVNLSTSSGAIVALADLDTLEVEADVAEANVARLADEPAGRGHGRGVPRPALPGRAAPGHPHRRPHQGDRAGEGDDPRQGPEPEAGDEREGDVPRARGRRPAAGAPPVPPTWSGARGGGGHARRQARSCSRCGEDRSASAPIVAGQRAAGPSARSRRASPGGETLVSRPPETLKDGDAVRVKSMSEDRT